MAVTPNTITVEFDRSLQEVPTYKAWQASPLKVSCSFPSGSSDTLSDVTTLTLEIRTSRTTSDAAVCSKALSTPFGNAPWVFELDSADMNLPIPEDLEQAKFFMQIVATMNDGDLDVLAAGDLVVYDNNFDGASVDPPGTVTYASASFTTIAVSGQSNVVADSATDTLTFAGSNGISITTNATTDTVTLSLGSTITTTTVQASGSSGLMFHTSGGSDVLILGAGGGVNATAYGTWNFDGATANTIASFGASKGLTSLSTSTYPSLTELSYVKGVTSAVQTQIDGKAASSHTHVSADITDASEGVEGSGGKLLKIRAGGYIGGVYVLADGLPGEAGGQVRIKNVSGTFDTIFRAEQASAERTIELPDASGTLALQEWANGGNITSLGTVTSGTWNGSVIGSAYGGAGTFSGLMKANGSGTVSAAVAGTDYLTPSGNGSSLTALNASNISSGTLALANGGTGGTESFSARRGQSSGAVGLPLFLNASANLTGASGSAGTHTANFYPFVYAPAATASKSRTGAATDAVGSPFGGTGFFVASTAVANFAAKWRFEFSAAVCLSAHTDSRVSFHLQCTSNPTTLDRPSIEGISIYWRGGASTGTAEIYTHDGTTGSSSSTGSVAIGDRSTARWALEWEPGVAVRLYRNNVLLCTKTTNLPSGDSATSNSQGIYALCENTTNGVTHPTGMYIFGGQILFFD